MNKPFLPSDIASRNQHLTLWRRFATIHAVAAIKDEFPSEVAKRLYGAEEGDRIMRSAVTPTTTTGAGASLAGSAIGSFLADLRPVSAAAQLIEAGSRFNLDGQATVGLPRLGADFPEPPFVAEAGAIPVKQGTVSNAVLGPPTKLAMIAGYTDEFDRFSAENAEELVTGLINDAASRSLDAAVFSTTAATPGLRPAGILNGLTPITVATLTDAGKFDAMMTDLQALIAAVNQGGGGAQIMLFANPVQALPLATLGANGISYRVIPAPSLAIGTVVALDPRAFASGFSGLPEVMAGKEGTLTFQDTAPAMIGTAGSPNVVAAPVMNLWQQDLVALRLMLRCAWAMRSGAIAFATGVNW